MKLTIDRAKWLRGEGSDESRLLRPSDGKMCCLGFYSLACGLQPEDIEDKADPAEAQETTMAHGSTIPEALHWLVASSDKFTLNSRLAQSLMVVNDNTDIGDAERETKIKEVFAEQGIEVEFV